MTIPFTETDDTVTNLLHYMRDSIDSIEKTCKAHKLDSDKVAQVRENQYNSNLFDIAESLQAFSDKIDCDNIIAELKQ